MIIKIITLISHLSFGKLYVLSDVMYFIIYKVAGYRKAVVRRNLATSFPEKGKDELREIERDFYHWLCDYFMETIKLLTISFDELKEHFEMRNIDLITNAVDGGQNVSVFLGHYGNWEWSSAVGQFYPETNKHILSGLIYHPLRNDTFDELMLRARSAMGGKCIRKKDILRELVACKRSNTPYLFGYVFDQSPKWENIHLWLDFMNHDTPVFTGAERLSRKYNDVVLFLHYERPERGRYVATFETVTTNTKDVAEYDVTRQCFKLLEDDIRRHPYLYLWSHNRWKRTREGWEEWKSVTLRREVKK